MNYLELKDEVTKITEGRINLKSYTKRIGCFYRAVMGDGKYIFFRYELENDVIMLRIKDGIYHYYPFTSQEQLKDELPAIILMHSI